MSHGQLPLNTLAAESVGEQIMCDTTIGQAPLRLTITDGAVERRSRRAQTC
jgi:hypothetical protein